MKTQKVKKGGFNRRKRVVPSKISFKLLKEKASSAFTQIAHPKMSENYNFVNTQDVLKRLTDLNFVPYDADQLKYRDKDNQNQGYQLHAIALYHPNMVILNNQSSKVEEVFEIIVTNSYNGYSKCYIYCTLYSVDNNIDVLCLSDKFTETIDDVSKINDDLFLNITNIFLEIVNTVSTMKKKILTEEEKIDIVTKMVRVRYDLKNNENTPYDVKHLLKPLRESDENKNDLWSIYKIVQEKLIKGYQFPVIDGEKIGRKIRSINHFQILLDINRRMFESIMI